LRLGHAQQRRHVVKRFSFNPSKPPKILVFQPFDRFITHRRSPFGNQRIIPSLILGYARGLKKGIWYDPVTEKERLRIEDGHRDKETGKPYDNKNAAVPHVQGYIDGRKSPILDPVSKQSLFH
jgi:hypothetical protein